MGQGQIKESTTLAPEWTTHHDTQQNTTSINPYSTRTLQHIHTKQLIQEYQLQFTSQHDYVNYARELEYRQENASRSIVRGSEAMSGSGLKYNRYLYRIRTFLNVSEEEMCTNMWKGLLYVDKVDIRLKEIRDIPFVDQLYLIEACLQGFKVLYEQVGYFDIVEEMIFVNRKGEVKVWLHPNLAKNQPYYISKNLQLYNCSQSLMIVTLLNLIEKNEDKQDNKYISFKQYLIRRHLFERLSFYKALEEFKRYCEEFNLHYRSYVTSVYLLYNERQMEERSEVNRVDGFDSPRKIGENNRMRIRESRGMMRKERDFLVSASLEYEHQSNEKRNSNQGSRSSLRSSIHNPFNHPKNTKIPLNKQPIIIFNNFDKLQLRKHNPKEQTQTPINSLNQMNLNLWNRPQFQQQTSGNQQRGNNLYRLSQVSQMKFQRSSAVVPVRINYVRKIQREQTNSNRMLTIASQEPSIRSQQINHPENTKFFNSKASFSTFSLNPTEIHPHNTHPIIYKNTQQTSNNKLSYFAVNTSYVIDAQIAQDIHKAFGVNVHNV